MKSLLKQFLVWRVKHLSERQFLLMLSAVVGLLAGLATVVIKNVAFYAKDLIQELDSRDYQHWLLLALPLVGLLIVLIIQKFVLRQNVGHGIPNVLFAIANKKGRMRRTSWFSSMITAPITVAFGGSVGLEGPSVGTSAGIGSSLARLLRLNYRSATLLLGCGAAASMSGIFNAPIAAVVFALEVIMLDLTMASLVPLLISSVTAVLISGWIMGDGALFQLQINYELFSDHLPWLVAIGILSGVASVMFSFSVRKIDEAFRKIKGVWVRFLTGAVILGVLIFLFPPLYGEGFETINDVLKGNPESIDENGMLGLSSNGIWGMVIFLILLVIFKSVATGVTFGSGGVGGVFAPCLFTGSVLGTAFSRGIKQYYDVGITDSQFALLGMSGLLAGALHSPLTAIFLIAEITSGYQLMIPLMITVTASFLVSKYIIPNSIYTVQLAERGDLITHHKDRAVLKMIELKSLIEQDFAILNPDMTLREITHQVAASKRNLFPVVDELHELLGVIVLDDLREVMFKTEAYDEMNVSDFIQTPGAYIYESDTMEEVMDKFTNTGAWNLPVVINGRYEGFISKSKLFNHYRKVLVDFSED